MRNKLVPGVSWNMDQNVKDRLWKQSPLFEGVKISAAVMKEYREIRASIGFEKEISRPQDEPELWIFLKHEAVNQYSDVGLVMDAASDNETYCSSFEGSNQAPSTAEHTRTKHANELLADMKSKIGVLPRVTVEVVVSWLQDDLTDDEALAEYRRLFDVCITERGAQNVFPPLLKQMQSQSAPSAFVFPAASQENLSHQALRVVLKNVKFSDISKIGKRAGMTQKPSSGSECVKRGNVTTTTVHSSALKNPDQSLSVTKPVGNMVQQVRGFGTNILRMKRCAVDIRQTMFPRTERIDGYATYMTRRGRS